MLFESSLRTASIRPIFGESKGIIEPYSIQIAALLQCLTLYGSIVVELDKKQAKSLDNREIS